ncbi:hypothetical protein N8787_03010 [Opitutaceae bacterium]|nr:hypothetical protein [Opitutaceae bacterium]
MDDPNPHSIKSSRKLAWILSSVFLFALIMGPGPGLYLINDYAASGGTVLGVPALYFWAVFWYAVEAAVVVAAYTLIWKGESE